MREWLRGRASPCQGEGRGSESRLALNSRGAAVLQHRFFMTERVKTLPDNYKELLASLDMLIDVTEPVETGLSNAAALIYQNLSALNWAGFYLVRGSELALGPFQGKPACTMIAKGKGVCGTAWQQDQTIRVEDVHAFPGHIACDAASNSEIVIPLHNRNGRVMGVLDLDSFKTGRFRPEDQDGLEEAARILEKKLFNFQDMTYPQDADAPVGIVDSGLGGLSVLKEMIRLLPGEDFLYRGDTLHAPYGTKTPEDVQRYCFESVAWLVERGIKALVVACNTATSVCINRLREQYDNMPVIGVEPALKPAVLNSAGGRILVMATPMTLQENKFAALMDTYSREARILKVPSQGLMEFVERGVLEGEELDSFLASLLGPYLPADAIVLGCTHYPFLSEAIRKAAGGSAAIYDGSEGTARELRRQLAEAGIMCSADRKGQVTILSSKGSAEYDALAEKLLYGN